MAITLAIVGKRSDGYTYLPEELLVVPEVNGRHELPDTTALEASILEVGQIQPVTIRASDGRMPTLVAGFSRWRAVTNINARRAEGEDPIRLKCVYTPLTEKQAFLVNIAENHIRNQTTAMDDAYNIQRLYNVYQMTPAEVAKAYGKSSQWVAERLSLLELTPEAEKEVRSGRIAPTAAKAIAKLSKDQQKKVLAAPGKITAKDVRRETAPAPPANPKPSLRAAALAIIGEADQQPDQMNVEIHKDNIAALRAALEA